MNQPLRFSAFIFGATLLLAGCAAHPGPVLATDDSGSVASPDSPAPLPPADSFSPEYEYAGHWLADGEPTPSDVTRRGRHVVSTYDNGGYKHVFVGDYVNSSTIKGIQTRLNRANNTTTRMRLTLTFLSPNSIRVDWVGLDSNSDLREGQVGVSMLQRVPTTSPQAPVIRQPVRTEDTSMKGVD